MVDAGREVLIRLGVGVDPKARDVLAQMGKQIADVQRRADGGAAESAKKQMDYHRRVATEFDKLKAKEQQTIERVNRMQAKEAEKAMNEQIRLHQLAQRAMQKREQDTARMVEQHARAHEAAQAKVAGSTMRVTRALVEGSEGAARLGRGLMMAALSGEKDMAKLAMTLLKVQAGFDILVGGTKTVISLAKAYQELEAAAKAAAAAQMLAGGADAAGGAAGGWRGAAAKGARGAAKYVALPIAAVGITAGIASAVSPRFRGWLGEGIQGARGWMGMDTRYDTATQAMRERETARLDMASKLGGIDSQRRMAGLDSRAELMGLRGGKGSAADQIAMWEGARQSAIGRNGAGDPSANAELIAMNQKIIELKQQQVQEAEKEYKLRIEGSQRTLQASMDELAVKKAAVEQGRKATQSAAERFAELGPGGAQQVLALSRRAMGGENLRPQELKQLGGFRELGGLGGAVERGYMVEARRLGYGELLVNTGQQARQQAAEAQEKQVQTAVDKMKKDLQDTIDKEPKWGEKVAEAVKDVLRQRDQAIDRQFDDMRREILRGDAARANGAGQ
ncbi:MAG: coiled-coil domain-containing protein [Pirellulales bacterium]